MKVQVQQFSWGNGSFRTVTIPSIDGTKFDVLERVFNYGQNEEQPQNKPSVSVGDVIFLNDEKHIVKSFGFEQITDELYNTLVEIVNQADDSCYKKTYRHLLYEKLGEKSFDYC